MTGDSISGVDAAHLGLALKAVPSQQLEDEVEGLADRFALIDHHLLSANKRIVNLGLELMGARTLQRLAAENDARAHLAPGTAEYRRRVRELGLRQALKERDAAFGDGRARVREPEGRLGPRPQTDSP
jgi:enoyl-CoA hydratase